MIPEPENKQVTEDNKFIGLNGQVVCCSHCPNLAMTFAGYQSIGMSRVPVLGAPPREYIFAAVLKCMNCGSIETHSVGAPKNMMFSTKVIVIEKSKE